MRKKEGVCWFPIDADGNAGMRRVKLARNYKGAIINYWGGGEGGEVNSENCNMYNNLFLECYS